jgi:hypothetical protein
MVMVNYATSKLLTENRLVTVTVLRKKHIPLKDLRAMMYSSESNLHSAEPCCGSGSWSGIRCFSLPPGSGSGMNFLRIPDLVDYDFAPETIWSKKKASLHCTFHVGSEIRDEKMFGSGSGMRKCSDPVLGSGIKHHGSATLARSQNYSLSASVPDPWNFGTDLDPRIRCLK